MIILCPRCGHPGYINAKKSLNRVQSHGFDIRHYFAEGYRIHHYISMKEALALLAAGPQSTAATQAPSTEQKERAPGPQGRYESLSVSFKVSQPAIKVSSRFGRGLWWTLSWVPGLGWMESLRFLGWIGL